jgi:hypothetical protein
MPSEFLADERRRKKLARDVFDAFHNADMKHFLNAIEALDSHGPEHWPQVMRKIAKSPAPSDQFRRFLLNLWRHDRDHIRQEVGDDLLLADALRVMLPPYDGPAITLYRGEGFGNRKRRTYGLSWSSDIEIARCFAKRYCRNTSGGSVLLEVTASPEAIVCRVAEAVDSYVEKEVVVDRRLLRGVKALERFGHVVSTERRHG